MRSLIEFEHQKSEPWQAVSSDEPRANVARPCPTIGVFPDRCDSGHKLAVSYVGRRRGGSSPCVGMLRAERDLAEGRLEHQGYWHP